MNLAEIRQKAQQAKEAQQASLEEQEQLIAETFDYEDEDPLDEEEDYSLENEAEDMVAPAYEPMFGRAKEVPKEDRLLPEDIFPEPMEVVLNAPELPDLELIDVASSSKDTKSAPAVEERSAPSYLDPVAILLKGREQAFDEDALLVSAGSIDKDESNFQELLCFRVASEEYALNIMEIKEIIKPREVTEVPRVPAFVSGVLSLRGIIIPIFDMTIRLGLPKSIVSGKERVIVVKHGEEGFCGILVDEVVQVVRIENRLLEPPPTVLEGIDRDFVSGIGRFSGRMLILLNMEKILDITLF